MSLGLAVIFGMLNIINFAHGALYMAGAMLAWMGMEYLGLGYWWMLVLGPIAVGLIGIAIAAETPAELAVSITAELISVRAAMAG